MVTCGHLNTRRKIVCCVYEIEYVLERRVVRELL